MTDTDEYWGQVGDTRHIFRDDRSLCGRRHCPTVTLADAVAPDDTYRKGTDCRACCRQAGLLGGGDA